MGTRRRKAFGAGGIRNKRIVPLGMPKSMLRRFRTVKAFNMSAAGVPDGSTVTSQNWLIDPRNPVDPWDVTGTLPLHQRAVIAPDAIQVNGWGEVERMFDEYVVVGCNIKITMVQSANTGAIGYWGIHLAGESWNTKFVGATGHAYEYLATRNLIPRKKRIHGGHVASVSTTKAVTASYNWKQYHKSAKGFDFSNLWATTNAEPSPGAGGLAGVDPQYGTSVNQVERPWFNWWFVPIHHLGGLPSSYIQMELEYICAFKSTKTIADEAVDVL